MERLPEGWSWIKLGALVANPKQDLVDGPFGSNLKAEEYTACGVPVLKIQNIKANRFVDKNVCFITSKKAEELTRHSFQKGDLIITKLGDPLGLCCKVPAKYSYGIIVADLMRLRPDRSKVNVDYLVNVINSEVVKKQFKAITKGTTRARVNLTIVRDILIPLPALALQQQIVSKIEELFSKLDKGVENLKALQQQLKVYRQAVLKWAFEGRLTNDNVKDGELPDGWKVAEVGQICKSIVPNRDKPKTFSGNIKWVTTPDLTAWSIKLNTDIIQNGLSESEVNQYKAKVIPVGSVIMTCVGTFGLSAVVEKPIVINQQLHAFLPSEKLHPKYLAYYIQKSKAYLEKKSTSTTIQYLNKESCNSLPLPICSIDEQRTVVAEIENRLSVCDKIEETIANALQEAEALRQSVLKRAFEGKLVEQKEHTAYKPKNEYFYQAQILGFITDYSKQKGIKHGEMTIAKYAFMLDKLYDVETYYDYKRWHLGPYPPEMKKVIKNKKYFVQSTGNLQLADAETLLKYSNPYKERVHEAIDDLASIFSKYSAKERSDKTELLATVCKVIEDIQSTDLDKVRQSMKEWPIELPTTKFKNKAEKFSKEDTESCIKFIMKRGWEKKLIK